MKKIIAVLICITIFLFDAHAQKIKFKIVNIDKETKRISLSYKATLENPWDKILGIFFKRSSSLG